MHAYSDEIKAMSEFRLDRRSKSNVPKNLASRESRADTSGINDLIGKMLWTRARSFSYRYIERMIKLSRNNTAKIVMRFNAAKNQHYRRHHSSIIFLSSISALFFSLFHYLKISSTNNRSNENEWIRKVYLDLDRNNNVIEVL
jgi:hypothetical protein